MKLLKSVLKEGKTYRLVWYAAGYNTGSQECVIVEKWDSSPYSWYLTQWDMIHTIPIRDYEVNQ